MQTRSVRYSIIGTMVGQLWWEGDAWKDIGWTFTRTLDRESTVCGIHEAGTLLDAVSSLFAHEAGDFRGAAHLTGDSVLMVERTTQHGGSTRTIRRTFPVSLLPTISDYVDADAFTPDPFDA